MLKRNFDPPVTLRGSPIPMPPRAKWHSVTSGQPELDRDAIVELREPIVVDRGAVILPRGTPWPPTPLKRRNRHDWAISQDRRTYTHAILIDGGPRRCHGLPFCYQLAEQRPAQACLVHGDVETDVSNGLPRGWDPAKDGWLRLRGHTFILCTTLHAAERFIEGIRALFQDMASKMKAAMRDAHPLPLILLNPGMRDEADAERAAARVQADDFNRSVGFDDTAG